MIDVTVIKTISLTSSLCKIAEDAIIKYESKTSTYGFPVFGDQFGFIPGSNYHVGINRLKIHRCGGWSETVNKEGECVRSLITDYRKAFDLIDHNILYAKLLELGLKPLTLKSGSQIF